MVRATCLLWLIAVADNQVTINRGHKWRENIRNGNIPMPFTGLAETLYLAADEGMPDWLWGVGFVLVDPYTFYYLLFVVFSALGLARNIAFFAFHVLDIAVRIKLLSYVLRAVTMNAGQVVATLAFGMVITYLYAVMGYSAFGFDSYSLGKLREQHMGHSIVSLTVKGLVVAG